MENSERTPIMYIPAKEFSLANAGKRADEMVALSTFARYRERKAPETLRRHRTDLALFITYLHQIPGLRTIGDLDQDPVAWQGMTKGLVEGFVQWQLQAGYAIGSINMRLSTVKLYCKLAQGAGVLDEDHAAMILERSWAIEGAKGSVWMLGVRSQELVTKKRSILR